MSSVSWWRAKGSRSADPVKCGQCPYLSLLRGQQAVLELQVLATIAAMESLSQAAKHCVTCSCTRLAYKLCSARDSTSWTPLFPMHCKPQWLRDAKTVQNSCAAVDICKWQRSQHCTQHPSISACCRELLSSHEAQLSRHSRRGGSLEGGTSC